MLALSFAATGASFVLAMAMVTVVGAEVRLPSFAEKRNELVDDRDERDQIDQREPTLEHESRIPIAGKLARHVERLRTEMEL